MVVGKAWMNSAKETLILQVTLPHVSTALFYQLDKKDFMILNETLIALMNHHKGVGGFSCF